MYRYFVQFKAVLMYILLDSLSAYYLSNRYPDLSIHAGLQLNKNEAEVLLTKTREAFTWLYDIVQ